MSRQIHTHNPYPVPYGRGYAPRVPGYPTHQSVRRYPHSPSPVHSYPNPYYSPTPVYPPGGGGVAVRVPSPRAQHAGETPSLHTPRISVTRKKKNSKKNSPRNLSSSGSGSGPGPSSLSIATTAVNKQGGIKNDKEDIDSRTITSAHKRRSKAVKELKEAPGRLCIREAYPPPSVLNVWGRMMKAHDVDPRDGDANLKRKNICFVWMPNASWASDGRLNGYVFTVEGKEGHVSSRVPTRVIPDMFPMDKLFHGTLCIRLPNESTLASRFSRRRREMTKIHEKTPMEVFQRMTPYQVEKRLNEALKDEEDFSSDGSFAGFYMTTDPNREWEQNLWIVVHTGDRDISRTVWYFLKGLYDPTKMNEEKSRYSSFGREEEEDDDDEGSSKKKHIFVRDTKAMQETLKRISESYSTLSTSDADVDARSSEDVEEDKNVSEEKERKKGVQRRRRRRKKVSAEYYSSSEEESSGDNEYYYKDDDDDDGYQEEDTDLLTVDQRLKSHFIHPDERKAWKYTKVLNELYRRTVSYLPSGIDPNSKGVKRPSYAEPKPIVSWENDVIRESTFILSMEQQVKLKRWKIAARMANILGFDLSLDFNIHPEKGDVDNHVNVVHVTTNTFGFNKKNAKTTYYCGSFCRRDIVGAVPVPISPLTGIKLLYGPISSSEPTPCYKGEDSEDRFVTRSSGDVHDRTFRTFYKRSYSLTDNDDDLGGIWSLKNEPSDSEDCFGAFPYGTGRASSYLRLSPSDIGEDDSNPEVESRVARAQQTSIGGVRVIAPKDWGPRGLWCLMGTGSCETAVRDHTHRDQIEQSFRQIPNSVLFTWNDKRYKSHPKLARGVYRPHSRNFQTRQRNLGWKSTLGSLHLKPLAVQMCSPVDPNSS
jgi:hypothetical protein